MVYRRELRLGGQATAVGAELLAAKNARPIRSLDDLAADTFESDEELDDILAFTYAERHRELA